MCMTTLAPDEQIKTLTEKIIAFKVVVKNVVKKEYTPVFYKNIYGATYGKNFGKVVLEYKPWIFTEGINIADTTEQIELEVLKRILFWTKKMTLEYASGFHFFEKIEDAYSLIAMFTPDERKTLLEKNEEFEIIECQIERWSVTAVGKQWRTDKGKTIVASQAVFPAYKE